MTPARHPGRIGLMIVVAAVWAVVGCGEPTSPAADPPPTSYVLEDQLRFTGSARFEPEYPLGSGSTAPRIIGELTVENVTDERVAWSFPMGGCMRAGRLYREGAWKERVYETNPSGCLTGRVLVDLDPGESTTPEEWMAFLKPDEFGLEPGLYRVALELLADVFPRAGPFEGPEVAAPEPVEVPAEALEEP